MGFFCVDLKPSLVNLSEVQMCLLKPNYLIFEPLNIFLQEIHKKVMSLQFSECHTKIRHVDAHATLSDGVVVQVLGELSNNGQPMRKFMQTFVLAPEVSTVK